MAAAALPALWEEACGFYAASLAKSTAVQYTAHVRNFAYFCVAMGLDFARPTQYTVMVYVALLARSVAAGTVRQYLKGLKDYYKKRGFREFADPVAWPCLYAALKGVDRVKKVGVNKKCPVTPAMLLQFHASLTNGGKDVALWACVLVTFFGYFRKSNTTSESASPFGAGKCIRVCDVEVVVSKHALKISVQEAKNRQFSKGATVWVAGCVGHVLDPVRAWQTHMRVNRLELVHHAFSFREGKPVLPMRHSQLVQAAKAMAVAAGMNPSQMAGHSFRRGGASFAFQCGVPDILIQRQGDWASVCYREYITLSADQALSATSRMFSALSARNATPDSWGASLQPADAPVGHLGTAASAEWLLDE